MRGNTLGVDATYPIADALESRPELRYAQWSDLFTGRLKEEIPKTLVSIILIQGLFITETSLQCNDSLRSTFSGIGS